MSEMQFNPIQVQDEQAIRASRSSFRDVGIDNFTQPPAQNPDMFLQLLNVLPPEKGILERRWGFRFFNPKIDTGANVDDDET